MSKILGLSEETTANASLFIDGKPIAAIAQERLNRRKFAAGFPGLAIKEVLRIGGVFFDDIDTVVVANNYHFIYRLFPGLLKDYEHDFFSIKQKMYLYYHDLLVRVSPFRWLMGKFNDFLVKSKIGKKNIFITDHHASHAYSAYMTSGYDRCLTVTIDNMGDGLSCGAFVCENGKCLPVERISALHSPGQFYGEITQFLGFDPLKHAGKITGLAAYGDGSKAYHIMEELFQFDSGTMQFKLPNLLTRTPKSGPYKKLKGFSREDVAAGAQRRLEDVVIEFIKPLLKKNSMNKIALAGGVFGNVRLNQKIFELDEVDEIFIHPGMGDCGLSMGACLLYLAEKENMKPGKLEHAYLGPEYSDAEIENTLTKFGLKFEKINGIEKRIAQLLTEGKVIGRFNGRMEYGPRALGNRSILYQPNDVTVNDWLNKRLKRTEFMPFAPVTMVDHASTCYKNIEGQEDTARFMTIAMDCTDFMKKTSQGVVHVDNTARPQFISEKENGSYYAILKEYYKLTGIPGIINTSFNMHEEPIVCSPEDAVRAFLQGKIDCLAISSYLVTHPG
jgi:carbamoyltransferase